MTKARIEPGKTDISIRNKEKPETTEEHDPRAELGLKSPTKDKTKPTSTRSEAEGKKATEFSGNPSPQGAASGVSKPKDDTPMNIKKSEGPRDDQ